jgi:multidrug efflux system outer membrane protein
MLPRSAGTRPVPRALLLTAGAALALTGCKMGPDYARPGVDTPDAYRDAPTNPQGASIADLPWWEVFQDPPLQELIAEALANNDDLRIAISRVEQARAIEVQTASPLYPQLSYGGGIGRGRNAVLGSPSPNDGATITSSLLTLNAAWELDLWGRIRRADEAALAEILAAEETRRAVMLSIVAAVAQAYIELLEFDHEIEIARDNVASFDKSLDLFTRRAGGGVDSRLQVLRATANQAQVAASIPELQRLTSIKENQISLLLGRNPGPIPRGQHLLDQPLPGHIPAGLPSDLLERRPDIRSAEQRLVAANARIGVALADYFPRIGLTAFFGKVSPELSAFTDGSTNAWSVAGALSGPLFTAGRLQGQEAQVRAEWDEARQRYEQTVRTAFGEVADTLITREKLEGVENELGRQVTALDEAVNMSRQRYDVGRANYFEILDAQQQLFPAQTSQSRARADRLVAVVQLYRVLGGGWNVDTAAWTTRTTAQAVPPPVAVDPATEPAFVK